MTKHKNKPIIKSIKILKKNKKGLFDLLDNGYKHIAYTSDLFEVTNCEDCNGTGQTVDKAPQGVTYELYEDCDTCNGTGIIQ